MISRGKFGLSRFNTSPPGSMVFLLVLGLLVSACAPLRPQTDPAMDKKARGLAFKAAELNRKIRSSKGTGWLKVETEQLKDRFRIAWAAQAPDRVRMTLLAAGHPVETVVSNGKSVTFISHTGSHKPHTSLGKDPDLERVIGTSIRVSKIIALLLGQVPVGPFDDAWMPGNAPGPIEVVLKQNFNPVLDHIQWNGQENIDRLFRGKSSGPMIYEIQYLSRKSFQGAMVPDRLVIKNPKNGQVWLTITGFIPNPPLKESVFQLTDSGS